MVNTWKLAQNITGKNRWRKQWNIKFTYHNNYLVLILCIWERKKGLSLVALSWYKFALIKKKSGLIVYVEDIWVS